MGTSRSVAAVACAAMLLSGCASVKLPASAGDTATINSFPLAAKRASDLASGYLELANESKDDMMWTELPIFGTALFAVTAVSFGWHADYAKAAAVGGGGLAAVNAFTQPRAGVKRNVQAMAAMSCVARLAANGEDVFSNAPSEHLKTLAQVDGLAVDERKGLELAAKVGAMGPHVIGSTIDTINADVLVRATDSMTAPSFEQIVADITKSAQSTAAAKAGTGAAGTSSTGKAAKEADDANKAAKTSRKNGGAGLVEDQRERVFKAAAALDPADVQRAVDYAAELEQQLAVCAAKVRV